MDINLEDYKKYYEEIRKYASQVTSLPKIEERDPNYVYLMHHTSLSEEDIQDVYLKGIAYEANDLARTFNNLSKDWNGYGKSWAKERADMTSMEEVIVEQCKRGDYQCFLYKIPLSFIETVNDEFYPIPIWNLDKDYIYKVNMSSSKVQYDITSKEKTFFRVHPKLLLGHYDLKTNTFNRNLEYSPIIDNPRGIFDRSQIFNLSCNEDYQGLWQHNEFIIKDKLSPYENNIREISYRFTNKNNSNKVTK